MLEKYLDEQKKSNEAVSAYLDAKYSADTKFTELRRLENIAIHSFDNLVKQICRKYRNKPDYEDFVQLAYYDIAVCLNSFQQSKCPNFSYWLIIGLKNQVLRKVILGHRRNDAIKLVGDDDSTFVSEPDRKLNALQMVIIKESLSKLSEEDVMILKELLDCASIREITENLNMIENKWTTYYVKERIASIVDKIKL